MARGGAAAATADDVPEGGAEAPAEAPAKPKRFTRKRLMIIGGALAVAAAGAWQFGLIGGGNSATLSGGAAAAINYYRMPELIVNLDDESRSVFIRLTITLQYSADSTEDAIARNLPRINDALHVYLHELRTSDLSGSAGLYRLKDGLRQRINQIIFPAEIDDVLFEDYLIQ
jgi:flagellar FliL protein